MPIIYITSLKDTHMADVVAAIDNGGAGSIEFGDSTGFTGADLLAIITFNSPCGTVSGGVLTFATSPSALVCTIANSGIAAQAQVLDGTGHLVISGLTVGLAGSGSDIIFSSTTFIAGQPLTLTAANIIHG